ncbi:MAG: 50S ribosomal protein L23 [Thermodesulfobacteriota bacterium]
MEYTRVLHKPLVSEKATWAKDMDNQVVFLVDKASNKIEIRKAVEKAFGVKVERVNVTNKRPRTRRRFGREVGRVPGTKKAYVTLAPGEKIEFFEGV